jgi:GNAT superfamily N-acetyltransferase
MPAPEITVDLLPASAAPDGDLTTTLAELVNRVYRVAEAGLWVDRATRTNPTEVAAMIGGGEIAAATARRDGAIVGTVRIVRLDDRTGELGMLVADPDRRGIGIGRDLVRFAEDLSRRRGLSAMQLELLVPQGWTHPEKVRLHDWYSRIGYAPVRKSTLDETYPHLTPLLATPCDLVIYEKDLKTVTA